VNFESSRRWSNAWRIGGVAALRKTGRAGRKPRPTAAEIHQQAEALAAGPRAHRFAAAHWTARRVASVIGQRFIVMDHPDDGLSTPPVSPCRLRDSSCCRTLDRNPLPKSLLPAVPAPCTESRRGLGGFSSSRQFAFGHPGPAVCTRRRVRMDTGDLQSSIHRIQRGLPGCRRADNRWRGGWHRLPPPATVKSKHCLRCEA
jgi:hypothetical protein